jgi:hypothetical protein
MGDLHVKVGCDNQGMEHVMGTHGVGEASENGNLFMGLCQSNDLVIGGTLFPHKLCHKIIRTSPNLQTKNQID